MVCISVKSKKKQNLVLTRENNRMTTSPPVDVRAGVIKVSCSQLCEDADRSVSFS